MNGSISTAIIFSALLAFLPVEADGYDFRKPLYGAAYYAEYTPTDRLERDIRLMKEAGLTVVRVGESTWSLFEPREGVFEFEWMDRILDALDAAGIKVILGTPTYSIPAWMAASHPEVLAHTYRDEQRYYGIRQNMDIYNPTYRFYCERIIRKMMEHFAQHPAIIGYQVDNEVEAREIDNEDFFEGFKAYIKNSFGGDLKTLNARWGLNYWGMNINSWDEFYDRKGVTNPSYKLWWERWNRKVTADFLNWQIDIVNEYRRPDQFVTHCFMPAFHNIDQVEAFRQMEYPAINIYYTMQDSQDGMQIGYACDFTRTVAKNHNFIITETNAQATGWSSRDMYPPYDGQLRQNMYSMLAGGSNMVEYWHWATLHYGQETYWRGILGHDGEPNRVYNEFMKGAGELERIGDKIVNLRKKNRVAILYSHDSKHALDFMPYTNGDQYKVNWIYSSLYRQNIECDILPVDNEAFRDFSSYDLLIIPPLYVASEDLMRKISDFVKDGGDVVMFYKSGYTNTDNAAYAMQAPGHLAAVCGFTYQEFSSIRKYPIKSELRDGDNYVRTWLEFLQPTSAEALAYVDDPFFGQWPCITENAYGKGHLIYLATEPSDDLLDSVISRAATRQGIRKVLGFPISVRSAVNPDGDNVHFLFNYSGKIQEITYPFDNGKSLLDSSPIKKGQTVTMEPWGVFIGID